MTVNVFLACCVVFALCLDEAQQLQAGVAAQKDVPLKFSFFTFDMREFSSSVVRVEKFDTSSISVYYDWNKPPTESNWLYSQTSGVLDARIDACENGTLFIGVWNNNWAANATVNVTAWNVDVVSSYCALSYRSSPWFFRETFIALPSAETLLFVGDVGSVHWFSSHTYNRTLYRNVSIDIYVDVAGPGGTNVATLGSTFDNGFLEFSVPEWLPSSMYYYMYVGNSVASENFAILTKNGSSLRFPCALEKIGVYFSNHVYLFLGDRRPVVFCDETFDAHIIEEWTARAVLYKSRQRPLIVVAFRGTILSISDWIMNLRVEQSACDGAVEGCGAGYVHSGFLAEYLTTRDAVRDEVAKHLTNDTRFLITGHSQGAAVATLQALDIAGRFKVAPERLFAVTIGSPRVGNDVFAARYKQAVPNSVRFVAENNDGGVLGVTDPVTLVPGLLTAYEHVGRYVPLECDLPGKRRRALLPDIADCHSTRFYVWGLFYLTPVADALLLPSVPVASPPDTTTTAATATTTSTANNANMFRMDVDPSLLENAAAVSSVKAALYVIIATCVCTVYSVEFR